MSPHKWLLPVMIILSGCDEEAEDAAEQTEHEAPESGSELPIEEAADSKTAGSFGPDNTWWHTDASQLPAGLTGTGIGAGDTAYDFTLRDQNGDLVQLYQFYGQVIVLNVFVEWAYACQDITWTAQQMWEDLEDDGFVYLSVMVQDTSGGPPDVADAAAWASQFGLTHPVLADPGGSQDVYAQVAYPTLVVIDRDMTIIEPDFWPMDPLWLAGLVLE